MNALNLPPRRRFLATALAATVLMACASVQPPAEAATHAQVTLRNRSTGAAVPLYRHNGQWWAEGRPGERYGIELRNLTGARILTTISVDGVNVISGETASTSQSGYVLAPWTNTEIAGWRKNMNEVAAFYFSALSDAYASRTGRPDHVGVIGVAVFTEMPPPPPAPALAPQAPAPLRDMAKREAASNVAAQSATAEAKAVQQERIGTGHGERIEAPTQSTEFHRASSAPAELITIRYDTRANLIARGVIRGPRPQPQPFPAGGFVPDPA